MTDGDRTVQVDLAGLIGPLHIGDVAVRPAALFVFHVLGQVETADDHVLGRGDQRTTMGRRQHVVRRQHQHASFGLSLS